MSRISFRQTNNLWGFGTSLYKSENRLELTTNLPSSNLYSNREGHLLRRTVDLKFHNHKRCHILRNGDDHKRGIVKRFAEVTREKRENPKKNLHNLGFVHHKYNSAIERHTKEKWHGAAGVRKRFDNSIRLPLQTQEREAEKAGSSHLSFPVTFSQARELYCVFEEYVPFNHDSHVLRDGATSHTARISMDAVNALFPGRVISRKGDIAWPPRSPDLTIWDFFLWGYLKTKVFGGNPPRIIPALKQRIREEVAAIPVNMLGGVMQQFVARLEECVRLNGGHLADRSDDDDDDDDDDDWIQKQNLAHLNFPCCSYNILRMLSAHMLGKFRGAVTTSAATTGSWWEAGGHPYHISLYRAGCEKGRVHKEPLQKSTKLKARSAKSTPSCHCGYYPSCNIPPRLTTSSVVGIALAFCARGCGFDPGLGRWHLSVCIIDL
ncbi:hypothetical protein ANN_13352 [Periplaneta americana]|uniref:Uncharacterized protein n=1 Tax=Periplaneta americana TaxID=6978 RepID=A0ABQ8TMP1_PERAM|nr:hypothetical protein ANN_13352 [Periplaneta americana]